MGVDQIVGFGEYVLRVSSQVILCDLIPYNGFHIKCLRPIVFYLHNYCGGFPCKNYCVPL